MNWKKLGSVAATCFMLAFGSLGSALCLFWQWSLGRQGITTGEAVRAMWLSAIVGTGTFCLVMLITAAVYRFGRRL